MTTLENLYYGNIAPHEYEVVRGINAKLKMHKIAHSKCTKKFK